MKSLQRLRGGRARRKTLHVGLEQVRHVAQRALGDVAHAN